MTSSFMQQLLQLSTQPTAQRPSVVAGLFSTGLPACSLQTAATPAPPAPPLQAVQHSSALFSGTPTRPPHISSISPSPSNLQVGSEIRAPAPHLQPFRPSTSLSTTSISSLSRGMPSQQVPSNSPTSPTLSQLPSRLPPCTPQSVPHNRAHYQETAGILPTLSSASPPAFELQKDLANQTSTNPIQPCNLPPLTDVGSNPNPLVQSEHNPLNSTRKNPACPTEVVCLSDDD